MIPRITEIDNTQKHYLDFIESLKNSRFEGELNPDYANRVVLSTDNSIYQVLPQGVVYPKSVEDLTVLASLVVEPRFNDIVLSARGGGTGTNGQSLSDGLIVDVSRHMNQILEINADERWVRVQGGVVKDQLNLALKPYGLFFAPELSTSNRATIGGMINTDASGQGSCMYGKTRDHVLELKSVFLDGTLWSSGPIDDETLEQIKQREDRVGEVHRVVDEVFTENRDLIDAKFPKLNRCLTGYDLAHIRDEEGRFNLNSVLCGAEGSLAFIAEAKLNVLPIPKYSALVNLKYSSFQESLEDAADLMSWGPTSIETVDSKVLNLAMNDIIWESVKDYFPQHEGEPGIQGINLVEYTGDDEEELRQKIDKLTAYLDTVSGSSGKAFGFSVVFGTAEVNKIWGMRKKSVGLLGNAQGERRPIPFVEDTAVPPENLAAYIKEFRELLDSHNLAYGMFGHVDAGVLHVRPAIDMKNEKEEGLIRIISDAVVALTQKYHGLIWGEHGKGVRSEYAPAFFGELYPKLQIIKGAFDPANQLNPGKICTPMIDGAELLKIDEVPTRGQFDRQIPAPARDEYKEAMFCNGNGGCYNFDPNDAMCPSWKATRERKHSPKGRASLIREWLRLMSLQGVDVVAEGRKARYGSFISSLPERIKNSWHKKQGQYDFNHEVHEAMMGCLACKSCVAQCPIKVNVPDFRSRFLEAYYSRYLRPMKDYMVGGLEYMIPYLARFPGLYNGTMNNRLIRSVFKRWVGMIDSPPICTNSLKQGMDERNVEFASAETLSAIAPDQRDRSVIIVQDAFTSYFETQLVLDVIELLQRTGFTVLIAPFKPNGKPLHVHGFKGAFNKAADANTRMLQEFTSSGIPMIGIDPSMTLTYRQEYVDDGTRLKVKVELLQEWLAKHSDLLNLKAADLPQNSYKLMAHCSEKTSAAASMADWKTIYQALGQTLDLQATGCCGMAGTYGHETENYDTSRKIYDLSWAEVVADPANEDRLVASGYSCRSQVKRLDEKQIPHPAQVLLGLLQART